MTNMHTLMTAHPRPPRHRSRSLPRREAAPPTRRRARRLHFLLGIDQDAGEHVESDVCGGGQHVWVPDAESVEGE